MGREVPTSGRVGSWLGRTGILRRGAGQQSEAADRPHRRGCEALGMASHYDLIVIGSGTAASVAASRCRAAGWRVAVIDHLAYGGTCALRGCDPKKVLVGAAEALDHVRRMRGKGLAGGEPSIDWDALMRFKRTFTRPVPPAKERSFAAHGIDAYHGVARFCGPRCVAVGDERLEGRYVLLAVGAVPVSLGIAGEEHLASSTDFLDLDRLPRDIVLVGGGFIAAEFSHVAARAGARVTILQRANRLLTAFDPDLTGWLMDKFREIGIEVRLDTEVKAITKDSRELAVQAVANGREVIYKADLVVHAAGRVPDLALLDLPAGNVASDKGRLRLNAFLQSESNPAVYAAGDAAMKGPPLTPVASHDAAVAAQNMLDGNHRKPDYRAVPSVAFTIPPIAAVGMSEAEARERGLKYRVRSQKASDWYSARRLAEETYGFKVLIEEGSERILGAHLLGPQVEEVINVFALAMRSGLSTTQLKTAVFAYPTGASDISHML